MSLVEKLQQKTEVITKSVLEFNRRFDVELLKVLIVSVLGNFISIEE